MRDRLPGVILAGGRATRMGGGDKPLQRIGGRTLLDHVIDRLGRQCAPLALNANGDPARFAELGLPVLCDDIPGHVGPLAGVLAGLDWAAALGAPAIVTAAADTPFFPDDLARRLRTAAGSGGLAIAATRDCVGQVWRQPTFGLWPVALRDDLRAALAGGLRKIVVWTDRHGCGQAVWDATPTDPFFNINTPDDLTRAEGMLAG